MPFEQSHQNPNTPILDGILKEIKTAPIDFDKLYKAATQDLGLLLPALGSESLVPGFFLEVYLELLLNTLAQELPGSMQRLRSQMLFQSAELSLSLEPRHGLGFTVFDQNTRQNLVQLDQLFLIKEPRANNFAPVIVEAKMSGNAQNNLRALKKATYERRIQLVSKFFDKLVVSYVIVVARDSIMFSSRLPGRRVVWLPLTYQDFAEASIKAWQIHWKKHYPVVKID